MKQPGGQLGPVLQIDESKLGKRKYYVGLIWRKIYANSFGVERLRKWFKTI